LDFLVVRVAVIIAVTVQKVVNALVPFAAAPIVVVQTVQVNK